MQGTVSQPQLGKRDCQQKPRVTRSRGIAHQASSYWLVPRSPRWRRRARPSIVPTIVPRRAGCVPVQPTVSGSPVDARRQFQAPRRYRRTGRARWHCNAVAEPSRAAPAASHSPGSPRIWQAARRAEGLKIDSSCVETFAASSGRVVQSAAHIVGEEGGSIDFHPIQGKANPSTFLPPGRKPS